MTTQFDSFVASLKQKDSTESTIDWQTKKQEWLSALSDFYQQIESYLEGYIDNETVYLTPRPKTLHEEHIGEYDVVELVLTLGKETVYFTPKGTNLIGAKGRVDMRSSKGSVRFVLVEEPASKPSYSPVDMPQSQTNKEHHWAWKIATPPPKIHYADISQESFQEALMEVVNG